MHTLLATVCLPRWRHERDHRHHAAFPLPSRNCAVSHSPALAPIPERGIEKRAQGGLVGKQLRFLEVVSAATGSPWPRWLLPACGSPRPLAITIANGIRLPSTLCRWGGGKASAVQLACGLRNLAALVAGSFELVCGRQARAIAAGDGCGTVGRAAGNLVECHLSGMAVIESHNHHAEVQKIGDDREQRRLLPAMLRGARGKRAADLAVQCSA